MPSSLTPIMVDLDVLKKAIGCRDKKLLKKLMDATELPDDDTDVDDYEVAPGSDEDFDIDEIEELPSSQDALRHIIMGEKWAKGIGSKYGYAFHEICLHFGERLESENWGETRAEFVSEFQKVLVKAGLKPEVFSFENLVFGDSDFKLPPRSDCPYISATKPSGLKKAAKALAAVDREKLEAASKRVKISRGAIDAEFVVACFDEVLGWCQTCADAGKGLVVVYF